MVNNALLSDSEIITTTAAYTTVLTKIITVILILVVGFIVGRIIKNLSLKLFEAIELDKLTKKKVKGLSKILSNIIGVIIYILSILIALNTLKIAKTIITIVIFILVIISIFFIIFGINDIILNFFAGLIFSMKRKINLGDEITIINEKKVISGKVTKIRLSDIQIDTGKKEIVIIPKTLLLKSKIKKKKQEKD
ncbi:MAG: hypothetical protein KatS3mg002_0933 [Candidatus Woesearchaeota archaeon]|nr:MAG: hypothetical protein KatS3mg002_0933 [Candidatus Woesearchaeota archaeon]